MSIAQIDDDLLDLLKAGKINREAAREIMHKRYSLDDYATSVKVKVEDEFDLLRRSRQEKGLCIFCGGVFIGLFNKKCKVCGKEKNY